MLKWRLDRSLIKGIECFWVFFPEIKELYHMRELQQPPEVQYISTWYLSLVPPIRHPTKCEIWSQSAFCFPTVVLKNDNEFVFAEPCVP